MHREHLAVIHPAFEAAGILGIIKPDLVFLAILEQDLRRSLAVAQFQLAWLIERDQLSLAHKPDALAEIVRLFHVMRGEENRGALTREITNDLAEIVGRSWIQSPRWLIEKEH